MKPTPPPPSTDLQIDPLAVFVGCPRCGAVYEDLDGIGFVYCHSCGECTHPSADTEDDCIWYCTVCGREVNETLEGTDR